MKTILRCALTLFVHAIRRILGHRLLRAFRNEMSCQDLMAEIKSGRTGSKAAPVERVTASVKGMPDKETELILRLTEGFNGRLLWDE